MLACTLVPACSSDTTPAGPADPQPATSGTLELTLEVSGPRPDPDGFEVQVMPAPEGDLLVRAVESGGGTVHLADLPLTTYILRVVGLAAHCTVTGQHPRAITVRAGETAELTMSIFCPGPGALLVKTVSRGRDVGPAGYRVTVEAASMLEFSIGLNDSLLIDEQDLPTGPPWVVQLKEVPANCLVDGPNQRGLGALRGATVRIEYAVVCIPRSTRIAFEFGGGIYVTGGSEAVVLTNNSVPDHRPSLSPDRSRVVFSTTGPDLGDLDLYLVDTDGSGRERPLTTDGEGSLVGPHSWSPDGSRIVFWKTEGELADLGDIYVMNADGSGEVRLTHDGLNKSPAWSPNGSSIAFCKAEVGDFFDVYFSVYRMNADGSGAAEVVQDGCDPAWSPDGSKIAFTDFSLFLPHPDLAVVRADGSGIIRLHPGGVVSPQEASQGPTWSPDGSQIAYSGGLTGRIWIVDFDGAFGDAFLFRFGSAPSWR
jgi:hypothetical protein